MTDAERLREAVDYDPETGSMTWRKPPANRCKVGDAVGSKGRDGRVGTYFLGKRRRVHVLAWLYMTGEWPVGVIDHANGDPSDNRWGNLRAATHRQNMQNKRRQANNQVGLKGVSFHRLSGKWFARINVNGTVKSLGYHSSPEAAHEAYRKAALQYHGEFARTA